MSQQNPYHAPMQPAVGMPIQPKPNAGPYIGREASQLVVQHGASLPPFCVKTNQPATQFIDRTYKWHHPAIALTILASPIIYIILALVLQKKMKVTVPLSEAAYKKRGTKLLICRLLIVFFLLLIGAGIYLAITWGQVDKYAFRSFLMIVGGFLGLIIAVVCNQNFTNIIKPKKITDHHGWFAKVDSNYLNRLGN